MRLDRRALEAGIRREFASAEAAGIEPEPPVPKTLCTDGFEAMLVNVGALERHPMWTGPDDALGVWLRLAVAAWRQVPAASLPSGARAIAKLLRMDVRTIRRHMAAGRDGPFADWTLCADRRLYHPAISADAARAATIRRAREEAGVTSAAKRRKFGESNHLHHIVQTLKNGGKTWK